jgi:hypothetical protein
MDRHETPRDAAAAADTGAPDEVAILAVEVGRELAATVVSAGNGSLTLRVARGLVQASGGRGLTPGSQVRLRVTEAGAERVVLQVVVPDGVADPAATDPQATEPGDLTPGADVYA